MREHQNWAMPWIIFLLILGLKTPSYKLKFERCLEMHKEERCVKCIHGDMTRAHYYRESRGI